LSTRRQVGTSQKARERVSSRCAGEYLRRAIRATNSSVEVAEGSKVQRKGVRASGGPLNFWQGEERWPISKACGDQRGGGGGRDLSATSVHTKERLYRSCEWKGSTLAF